MNLKNHNQYSIKKIIVISLSIIGLLLVLVHGFIKDFTNATHDVNGTTEVTKAQATKNYHNRPTKDQADSAVQPVRSQIKGSIIYNDTGSYIINGNNPTIKAKKGTQEYVSNTIDNLRRPQVANAFLTKHSRQYKTREETNQGRTSWVPLGWHQMTNLPGKYNVAYNRGHLIAYALAGNVKNFNASESNHKNIITETAWANQANSSKNTGQAYYETQVRQALDHNKQVRYQVKPLYVGQNHVPQAIQIQAISTDNTLGFNVVIPNVQGNINISYDTGNVTQLEN